MSQGAKLLIGGGILLALVGGSFFMGSDPEPPRRPQPRRVVTTPAATASTPAPVVAQPAPTPIAAAKKDEEAPAPIQPRGLAMSDSQRLREAALEDIQRFEKAGRFQEALDALDEAEQNGADKQKLEPARVRLGALAAEARKVDDACAAADAALANGEFENGLRALRAADEVAKKLGRSSEIDDRTAKLQSARDRASKLDQGAKVLAQAQERLDSGDLAGARASVDKARDLVPGSPDLARVDTQLRHLEHLPAGFVYVVVAPDRALYVRKKPVSNADFKKWIDETGRTGAAPWKDGFTASESDSPVRGAFVDAAKTFAASRGERLPVEDEWPAIKKALHLAEESKPQAGVYANGFYTVKMP